MQIRPLGGRERDNENIREQRGTQTGTEDNKDGCPGPAGLAKTAEERADGYSAPSARDNEMTEGQRASVKSIREFRK